MAEPTFVVPTTNRELLKGDLIYHDGLFVNILGQDCDGDYFYVVGQPLRDPVFWLNPIFYRFPWKNFHFVCRPGIWHTANTDRCYPCPALCLVCPACVKVFGSK